MSKSAPPVDWRLIQKDMSKEGIQHSFQSNLHYELAKDEYTTTKHDRYLALALTVRDRLVERWMATQQGYHNENRKRVYYLSLEFLIGRLMSNNMINLGIFDQCEEAMTGLGLDIEEIREEEQDAGLGNGGLGRLAACFLDSMATMGIAGYGYGIRYDYGIFNQKIIDGAQVECPDEWLKQGNPWEFARPDWHVRIKFYGDVFMYKDKQGRLRAVWQNTQDVIAVPYDVPVPGYENGVVNTLRLWSARASEDFELDYFNDGDYEKAVYNKMFSENISKVLYPNDSNALGRELRLKQEYFFTAASIADIIRRFKTGNQSLADFPEKVAIQLNDTHPSLAVAELMRVLVDEEGIGWEKAWDYTVRTFAYTNHTVMPEALESWSLPLFERLLPRHTQIIYEINARFLREVSNQFPGDTGRLERVSLIQEGNPKRIRMGYLAIVGSHSVNGVSELHSKLLTEKIFKDFYEIFPERFNNKTNGITQRRWLLKSNPKLSQLISSAIGDKWVKDLYALEKLGPYAKDKAFGSKWRSIKQENKKALAKVIYDQQGIQVDPESLFDVQVKRIHEYKRQVLFAFYIISEYLRIKENPKTVKVPRTFIFGGKAAPGYHMAKLIIRLITSVGNVINFDKTINGMLKVVFLENYRVSLAEKVFPASDLSEQISTAGTEASGTGCMKFMMNGALTVGTLDGANIEMADAMGIENLFVFGLKADEVSDLKTRGYHPAEYINGNVYLKQIMEMLRSNFFSPHSPGIFDPLMRGLAESDPYLVCADFDSYCAIQQKISQAYVKQEDWTAKAVINVAKSGRFSSDRTIAEYAREIWGIDLK